MSKLSDELLEHFTHYPQNAKPGHLLALFQELKERRALSLLGDAATTDAANRRLGHTRLVYDKARRTIIHVCSCCGKEP